MNEYRNSAGDIVSLIRLCREEPEWAANVITTLKARLTLEITGRACPIMVLPRGPLAVTDCLQVAAVRKLVEAADESYIADRGLGKLKDALAPFLAAIHQAK